MMLQSKIIARSVQVYEKETKGRGMFRRMERWKFVERETTWDPTIIGQAKREDPFETIESYGTSSRPRNPGRQTSARGNLSKS